MSLEPPNYRALLPQALGLSGSDQPFPWQCRLLDQLISSRLPPALDIPTGLGKTAVMAIWLVARLSRAALPRRLVYIVDRRAVVDQATSEAERLACFVHDDPLIRDEIGELTISTLRGQHIDNRDWLRNPAACAIIVGTVDMIGSRLLFEGYGVSRKMRPYHAGLLGADTLLVLDEAHLNAPFEKLLEGLTVHASRSRPFPSDNREMVPPIRLISLSATGRTERETFEIDGDDLKPGTVTHTRLTAAKRLNFVPQHGDEDFPQALARYAWELTDLGTLPTRIVVFANKRKDAVEAKEALERIASDQNKTSTTKIEPATQLLVGGRRVRERERTVSWLASHGFIPDGQKDTSQPAFLFATSAGEVGVDMDADDMVCDLVEWERMVQRLGRVNRRGLGKARIFVIEPSVPRPSAAEEKAKGKAAESLDEKERKTVEAYERKKANSLSDFERRKRPFDLLPMFDSGIDVSPSALRQFKLCLKENPEDTDEAKARKSEARARIEAASTPPPLHPQLTTPLLDAWAMTSLLEHTGRPRVQPWLRGWIEDEPQTTLVWRKYLPLDRSLEANNPPGRIAAFFGNAPLHLSEQLELRTKEDVIPWLIKRVKAISETTDNAPDKEPPKHPPLGRHETFGILLDHAGEPLEDSLLTVNGVLGELGEKGGKERIERRLSSATLVLDWRFGGLNPDGMLDEKYGDFPHTLDGSDWLDDGAVPYQITQTYLADPEPPSNGWFETFRIAIEESEEGESVSWLVVKSRTVASADDDRGALAPREQSLADHQQEVANWIESISQNLALPDDYRTMLRIAALRHDEGKAFSKWQNAFRAPLHGRPYAKTRGPVDTALLDGYRHELGSLAVLSADPEFQKLPIELQDLALHLVAAHHGHARPILGTKGSAEPPSLLETSARDVALRYTSLQERWGHWGLAWWEALLRAADQQASRGAKPLTSPPATFNHG
jgi:CRISPR-associated endonuclease/helicase Cas3